jgi:nitroreductase/dihydropteridine reductase
MTELIESLEWRYACKKMNGMEVPREKVDNILKSIQLAPTSMGFQPFQVLLITDPALREKILPIANRQSQITNCSHLLVFAAWSNISMTQVEEYIRLISETRKQPLESLEGFKAALAGIVQNNTPEYLFQWSARQVYLAFGFALAAAAVERVDCTPMEGFDARALDKLLDLEKQGLRSVCLLPLGYRDVDNDKLAQLPKVRRQLDGIINHNFKIEQETVS